MKLKDILEVIQFGTAVTVFELDAYGDEETMDYTLNFTGDNLEIDEEDMKLPVVLVNCSNRIIYITVRRL